MILQVGGFQTCFILNLKQFVKITLLVDYFFRRVVMTHQLSCRRAPGWFGSNSVHAPRRIRSKCVSMERAPCSLACCHDLLPQNLTWNLKITPWKRKTFSKSPFWGSMLVFRGVYDYVCVFGTHRDWIFRASPLQIWFSDMVIRGQSHAVVGYFCIQCVWHAFASNVWKQMLKSFKCIDDVGGRIGIFPVWVDFRSDQLSNWFI